jgi:hypothetical protein
LSGLFEAIPWGGRAAVDQFDFGNSEGTAQGDSQEFGAPRTPLRKNGAWRSKTVGGAPNYV